ncbi:unnamed protein product [Moneuplotes crassus]|uniref:Uncharacterized protein n=1 Tax=Euplotes crassus TaxID=5936 RepID=A0AAD1U7C3_EUPCR|nr:unnamed protein product [Moneuplotes crassus]
MSQKAWRPFAKNFESTRVTPKKNKDYVENNERRNVVIRLNSTNINASVPAKNINQDLVRWHEKLKERIKKNKKIYKQRTKMSKEKSINLIKSYGDKIQRKIKIMQQITQIHDFSPVKRVKPRGESQLAKSFMRHLPTNRSLKKEKSQNRSVRPKVKVSNAPSEIVASLSNNIDLTPNAPEHKNTDVSFDIKEGKLFINELESGDEAQQAKNPKESYSNFTSPHVNNLDSTFTQGMRMRSSSHFRFRRKPPKNRNYMREGQTSSSYNDMNFDALKVLKSIRKFNSSALLGDEENHSQEKKEIEHESLNMTNRWKFIKETPSNSTLMMNKETDRLRKRNSYQTQLLESTFAAQNLVDSGLIDDLSELRLPKLMKSPFKTNAIGVRNSESRIYKMTELEKNQRKSGAQVDYGEKRADLDKAIEDMIFKTDLNKLNNTLKKVIASDKRIKRPAMTRKVSPRKRFDLLNSPI